MNERHDKWVAALCAAYLLYPIAVSLVQGVPLVPLRVVLACAFLVIPVGVFLSKKWGLIALLVFSGCMVLSTPLLLMVAYAMNYITPSFLAGTVIALFVDGFFAVFAYVRLKQDPRPFTFNASSIRIVILLLIAAFLGFTLFTNPQRSLAPKSPSNQVRPNTTLGPRTSALEPRTSNLEPRTSNLAVY